MTYKEELIQLMISTELHDINHALSRVQKLQKELYDELFNGTVFNFEEDYIEILNEQYEVLLQFKELHT